MSLLPLRAWEDTEKRKYAPEDYQRTARSLTILVASWIVIAVVTIISVGVIVQLAKQKILTGPVSSRGVVDFCSAAVGIALAYVIYGRLRQYSKWYLWIVVTQIANSIWVIVASSVGLPSLVTRGVVIVFMLLNAWLLLQAMGQQLRDTRAAGAIQELGERYFSWTVRYAWFAAGAIVAQVVEILVAEKIAGAFLMIAGLLQLAASICSIGWLVQYIRYVLQARRHFLSTPKGKKRTAK